MLGKPQAVCRHRPIQAILLVRLVLASSLRATAAAPLFVIRAVPLSDVSIAQMSMLWPAAAARPASHGSNRRLCPLLPLSAASPAVPAAQAAWCGSAAILLDWPNQREQSGWAEPRTQYVPVPRWQLLQRLPERCRMNVLPILLETPAGIPAHSAPYILRASRTICFRCAKAFAQAAGIRASLVLRALGATRSAVRTGARRAFRKQLAAVYRGFPCCLGIPVRVCAAWQRQAVPA